MNNSLLHRYPMIFFFLLLHSYTITATNNNNNDNNNNNNNIDHTNKWYIHNPTSVLENDTYKLLWNFDIQTDHLISAR